MSAGPPSTPRRAPPRTSHLRQVSNSGSDTPYNSRPVSIASDTGTIQHDPVPAKLPVERKCVMWVHDEGFSKDEVVLNLSLFPDVKAGEAMAIVALKMETTVRDFQEKSQSSMHESDTLSAGVPRERSTSNPRSPVSTGPHEWKHPGDMGKRYLFIARDMPKEMKAKHPNLEVSVAKHIADVFCLKHRSNALLSTADLNSCSASHVEMAFKDEYLARSDMWRLAVKELSNKTVYKGQKVLFMGTIKVQVTAVYVGGRKVQSAFFSTNTKPIFRSESARYVLFVQMSKEMWDFDSEGSGEIMFNKVVNGFLPALFKKWAASKAKHLVSIVLFTRVEYDTGIASEIGSSGYDSNYHTGVQTTGSKKPYKDFYRVVVSEMASGSWTTILYNLKREFKFFRRDISLHRIEMVNAANPPTPGDKNRVALGTQIEAEPSLAMHGNVLEAINLASSQFAHDYIDRDLMRTGISIVVITPCAGLFEVDYETLRMTTENLIGNGIGIDLVCLPKIPLHSVPLFRYRNPEYGIFQEALQYKSLHSEESTPRQSHPTLSSSFNSMAGSLSPSKASHSERQRQGSVFSASPPSEWSYAIPHWVDVSFWTGASQEVALGNSSIKVAREYLRNMGNQRHKDFAIRCKMYEMEMASVMENGMTEISITPLQHETLFPMMITGNREVASRRRNRLDPASVKRKKPYIGLVEFVGGPSKSLVDRHSTQDFKSFLKVLEAFDLAKSQLDEHPRIGRNMDGSKYFKTGSEEAARRLLAEDPKLFGTSFNDDSRTPKGAILMATSVSSRTRQDSQDEEMVRPRKASISSTVGVHIKTPPSIRPPKASRQISLGKHGFNLAAPKAAIAEIQIEHASATVPASTSKGVEPSKASSIKNHLFGGSTQNDRPSSSQSDTKPRLEKLDSKSRIDVTESEKTPSKPMTIKSALQSLDSTNQFKSRSVLGSLYEHRQIGIESTHKLQSIRPDDSHKLYNSKLLAGAVPELPATLSPTTALSPWLTVLNPSNPAENDLPSQYRRWQHVFPKRIHARTMKWKSLCCPASVPLTTGDFPTKHQLETEYQQKPYNISQNLEEDANEEPKTREEFLRELIGLRLSHGFQIVVGPAVAEAFGQKLLKIANVFDRDNIAEEGASVFMSLGNIIHQLSCVNETEIEVNMFVRKPTASSAAAPSSVVPAIYNPAIRTTLALKYDSRQIILGKPRDEYNWNYVDTYIAGFDEEMSETLRFWRARYVLIPVQRPTQLHRQQGEDNEEEIRLEGIKKLTQIWQRHRIVTAAERGLQNPASLKNKDPNPLDIVYKTEDPSVVVSAELETLPLLETGEAGYRRGQLIEKEHFRRNKLDIAALAEAIQGPVEKGGVRVQNRRWHLRLHYNCFIGLDMTTWLLENFEDIHTREEAVEFGNKLMVKDDQLHRIREYEPMKDNNSKEKERYVGMFVHVEKRHPFRDGQYFYQMAGDYAKLRPESRSGWFPPRRRDTSVPSTPLSSDSPRPERSRSSSNYEEKSSDSGGTTTPTTTAPNNTAAKKPKVALSKVMKYDVDHRKRSYRPERINLHYDRLHNPDNCYHIRIDWMSVTAKLIEDALASWAATAERYGLRLVEAPIGEACSITSVHPFRSPYIIKLAATPPDLQPKTYFDAHSFGPQTQTTPAGRHFYHKAIMKKHNFVLDIEAARNFPSNVDVTYSWGKPDFKYTQYIHRSGVVLAQITDEGDFLLLANRLYNNRTTAAREHFKSEHHITGGDRGGRERDGRISSSTYLDSTGRTPIQSPALRPTTTGAGITPPSPPFRAVSVDVLGLQSYPNPNVRIAAQNMITPETIKNELQAFCNDASALEAFFKETFEKAMLPVATPPNAGVAIGAGAGFGVGRREWADERNIPTLGLPPGVLSHRERERDGSPSPMLKGGGAGSLGGSGGGGGNMPYLGRRASVNVGSILSMGLGIGGSGNASGLGGSGGIGGGGGGGSGSGSFVDSPRGSISEGEK